MRLVTCSLLVLLALAAGSPAHAAKCTDTSGFQAAQESVDDAVPCSGKRKAYVRNAKTALKTTGLSKACQKKFAADYIKQSTCGRAGEICCQLKGKKTGRFVAKASKCKAPGKICTSGESAGAACTATGGCVTTTTTLPTTTTTLATTPTTTTTSTTIPPPPSDFLLDFAVTAGVGSCGSVTSDVAGTTKIANLGCGGLNIGGGNAVAPKEGPTPDGSVNRFGLRDCSGDVCTVVATGPEVQSVGTDCTNTGCPFGIPLPIKGTPDTCVLNSFAAPASGTINVVTGATSDLGVNLSSLIFAADYPANIGGVLGIIPCPVCVNSVDTNDLDNSFIPVAGTPATPATGVCSGGTRAGLACTTRNSNGLTADCKPGGNVPGSVPPRPCEKDESCEDSLGTQVANLGAIPVNLSPLATSAVSRTAADGLFCPGQTPGGAGCLSAEVSNQGGLGSACRAIFANGSPFGNLTDNAPHAGVLASVFCIPETSSAAVNFSANLPGPGEVTLPGTLTMLTVPTTTTTTSTTTTTLGGSPSPAFVAWPVDRLD